MVAALIWNLQTVSLCIFLAVAFIFFLVWAWAFGNAIDRGVDYMLNPFKGLVDNLEIKIVSEKPKDQEKPSVSQIGASSPLSTSEAENADDFCRPKGKASYVPE